MLPRDPMDFPHPFFAPFRDDPDLTVEQNVLAYWRIHDAYFARVHEYRALHPTLGDVRVPRDDVWAQLMEFMPPLSGREADHREWAGITSGRGCMAWDRARYGDVDGLNATTIELFEAYGPARLDGSAG